MDLNPLVYCGLFSLDSLNRVIVALIGMFVLVFSFPLITVDYPHCILLLGVFGCYFSENSIGFVLK